MNDEVPCGSSIVVRMISSPDSSKLIVNVVVIVEVLPIEANKLLKILHIFLFVDQKRSLEWMEYAVFCAYDHGHNLECGIGARQPTIIGS